MLGIDLGNEITKTSKMVKFCSRIYQGHKDMNKGEIKVEYKGEKYTVGSKEGTPVIGVNRIYSTMYDICLLTAIAKSSNESVIEENIILSLPPDLYESNLKNKLKDKLANMGMQEIIVDGVKKTIRIAKSDVFCENSIVFSNPAKYKKQRTLLVDIGGDTADISEFDGLKLVDHSTYSLGMIHLYESMKKAINKEFTSKLTADDMEKLIGKDMYEIRQEERDITFVKDVIADHVRAICNEINKFNYELCKIELIGGGAEPLFSYFVNEYPSITIVPDAQFANAKTNEMVGEMLWSV